MNPILDAHGIADGLDCGAENLKKKIEDHRLHGLHGFLDDCDNAAIDLRVNGDNRAFALILNASRAIRSSLFSFLRKRILLRENLRSCLASRLAAEKRQQASAVHGT